MNQIMMILQLIVIILLIIYLYNSNKNNRAKTVVVEKENKKEMEKLLKMRAIKLTEPLTEKSRPKKFEDVIGQQEGIKALKAAICGPNPQHIIIYGPPGVGKTAAARLVLEEAKKKNKSPFKSEAKFIEIDATTLRFDERGIADPLIGSVHDPIYQGAGALGVAGIPQPKPGAVTKAHGGILFIDEIGELHPIQINKLLKVLEDRKVFLDSSYYSSEDPNMPTYIREIFENGLPADFRLIGATTRNPEEIIPAIRSRCVEIFFRALSKDEISIIAKNAISNAGLTIDDNCLDIISKHCSNGREVVNLVQLCAGVAINEEREEILEEDLIWVLENGQYTEIIEKKLSNISKVGVVNGLAVHGTNAGMVIEVEAIATRAIKSKGELKISGIIEEEEFSSANRKMKRKSTAYSSVQNVLTAITNVFGINYQDFDIHINIPGGIPVDGPSAGITIATAVYSAIKQTTVKSKIAMTGEVSIMGEVKPIGGVSAKVLAAKKAGANIVIIPEENWNNSFNEYDGLKIIPVRYLDEVINIAIEDMSSETKEVLSAKDES